MVGIKHSHNPRGFTRKLVGILASLATMLAGGTIAVTSAQAASGPGLVAGYWEAPFSHGSAWVGTRAAGLGPIMMVDGKPVYCIQFGTIVGSAGGWTPLTGSDSGVGATMINQHASDMSDMTQAAVAYAIHDHLNVHDASEEIWTWWKSNGALDGASLPAVASLAAQFWTQASNAVVTNAGGGHNYTQAERTGTVNVGLHDAAGNYTSGVHFTIDMNGPAKFDATGNGHYEGYTNGTEMHIPWTATGNGNVSPQIGYDVTYGMLSTSAGQVLFRDNDPEHQTYNVAPFEVRKDFQPTVTTQVSNKVLKRGQKVMDKVTSGVDQTGQNAGGEWVGTRTA